MAILEFSSRVARLIFIVALSVVGYIGLLDLATGCTRTFFQWMFWPFILATVMVEMIQIGKLLPKSKLPSLVIKK